MCYMQTHTANHVQLQLALVVTAASQMSAEQQEMMEGSARSIALLASSLLSQGLQVCITLESLYSQDQPRPPPPSVLRILAPFLHCLHYHSATQDVITSEYSDLQDAYFFITPEQTQALQAASSLHILCAPSSENEADLPANMTLISSFSSLTTLQLSFPVGEPEFDPLAQLTQLEDLALQCSGMHTSCSAVIHSNKHTLQRLQLASKTWDTETYAALGCLTGLKMLAMKVYELSQHDAQMLGDLPRPDAVHVTLRMCQDIVPQAFHDLTAGRSKINNLTLWILDDIRSCELQLMPELTSLALVRCFELTGCSLQHLQPNLAELTFVTCPSISTAGVTNIVKICPALRHMTFHAELWPWLGSWVPASEHMQLSLPESSLVAMLESTSLQVVDLRGSRVDMHDFKAMEAAYPTSNAARAGPLSVHLCWDAGRADDPHHCEHRLMEVDQMHTPSFYMVPETGQCWVNTFGYKQGNAYNKVARHKWAWVLGLSALAISLGSSKLH